MCDILVGASKTHLFLSTPCHNCTPMIPNTTKISVQIAKTLPSMGNVSKSNATKILIPVKDQINLLKGLFHSAFLARVVVLSLGWLLFVAIFHTTIVFRVTAFLKFLLVLNS